MNFIKELFGMGDGGAVAKGVEAYGDYRLADMLLGRYPGPVMLLGAGFLAWKLTKMHRDSSKDFDWNSIPGIVAAIIALGLFFTGLFVLVFGMPG